MTTTERTASASPRTGQPDTSEPKASGGYWLDRFIRPDLGDAAGYDARHHDFAWQNRHLARLMSNECPIPPDESLIQAAVSAMTEGNLYPHSGWELRDAVAAFAGVDPSQVILGNGSTEILDVVTRSFITPGDEAVIPVPTYGFYETQVRLNGGRPILVPATADLGFNVPDVLAAIGPRTKLIFISSPNNPIGRSWTVEEIESLLATGIPTVIDQAYLECGPGTSFAALVARWPNLIVTRTFSKAFGLAAIRLGYGIADPALIDILLRVRIPFSVSLIATRVGLAAVRDPSIVERRRAFISAERDRLFTALADMPGVVPWPSETNFITIDVTATGRTSTEYVDEARAENLLLRRMAAHRLDGQYVRVTIGTVADNDRFLEVFGASVPPARHATA